MCENTPRPVTDHHLSAYGDPQAPFLACAVLPRLAVAAAAEPNALVQTPCGSQSVPGPSALLLSLAQSPSRRHCCRRCRELTPTVSVLTCARGPSAGSYFLLASYVTGRSRAGAHSCCFEWQRSSSHELVKQRGSSSGALASDGLSHTSDFERNRERYSGRASRSCTLGCGL